MRALLIAMTLVLACTETPPASLAPTGDLVLPTVVPNGRVEVVVKRSYPVGSTVRLVVRLVPTTGTLRGPIDPFIQASGFHGTATVKHLAVEPITALPGSASVAIAWDLRDDAGTSVGSDDYSLVFSVIDDAGRSTNVGATLTVR